MAHSAAPAAEEIPHRLEAHGEVRVDPWFWLKDRESPEVLAHLEAENAHAEAVLAPVAMERAAVLAELKARLQPDDASLPFLERGWLYYRRFEAGKEYPVYCRKAPGSEAEQILLDVNSLAENRDYCEAQFPSASPDTTKIVYAVDFTGRRFYDLHVVDIATGATLEVIPTTAGEVVWAADSRTLLFARQDEETLRAFRIFRKELGIPGEELVFEEEDEAFDVGLGDSRTGAWLFLVSSSKTSTEWRLLPSGSPRAVPRIFLPRERDHEYSLEDGGDAFYVVSNWEAVNFRLLRAPHDASTKDVWVEIVPHREGTLLESADFFATHFVLSERAGGQTRLAVVERAGSGGGARSEIAFPDPVGVAGVDVNQEFDATFLRYRYESLHRPASLFDYDFRSGVSLLRREQPVPTYDSSLYASERLWAPARDGTRIPISLVRRKDFAAAAGRAPLLVYGYGSYGFSMDPWFQSDVVSLLDRGFAYAVLHVRGGSEMGREWYDGGKLLRKRNTFTDFIDATEYLVKGGHGDPARVYASGASAGGLLMGVIANERPELYRGIVAGVPFVDVLTTMLDDSIPLTTSEYEEWGDPREEAAYRCMRSYSPYDNVKAQPYPAMLITGGLHDSQVQYWEPAKWAAKLRKFNTGAAPVLLYTEMEAGHGGASGRFEALEQTAREHAFLLMIDAAARGADHVGRGL